jgi:hypothetical protein
MLKPIAMILIASAAAASAQSRTAASTCCWSKRTPLPRSQTLVAIGTWKRICPGNKGIDGAQQRFLIVLRECIDRLQPAR